MDICKEHEKIDEGILSAVSEASMDERLMSMPRRKARKTKKKRTNPETSIQKDIVAFLRNQNIFVWRNNMAPLPIYSSTGTFSGFRGAPNKGIPDLMAVIPATSKRQAMLFSIEVKTAIGKTSPEQNMWLEKLNQIGTLAIVARSVDEVKNVLNVNGYLIN